MSLVDRTDISSEQRAKTVAEERYRLSREIHDGLAQTLGYLSLQAERLEGLLASQRYDAAANEIAEMRQSISAAYSDVRETIDGLRVTVNGSDSLVSLLVECVRDFEKHTGVVAQFSAVPANLIVDAEASMQLLRIVQEALTNVRKYATAHHVRVTLKQSTNTIELVVTDDGCGLPAVQSERNYQSHGLAMMRERAEGLGGTFTVTSEPGKGTRVTVVILKEEN
jgi:signal transduction histidine kinase